MIGKEFRFFKVETQQQLREQIWGKVGQICMEEDGTDEAPKLVMITHQVGLLEGLNSKIVTFSPKTKRASLEGAKN